MRVSLILDQLVFSEQLSQKCIYIIGFKYRTDTIHGMKTIAIPIEY